MTMTALSVERAPLIPAEARCIAYVRVSTERQAGESKVSPDTQLARCNALAAERGYTVEHVIEDHESGAHKERLYRLVAACRARRLPQGIRGLIVVYDTSRWGRFERPGVAQMFREMLYEIGWDVLIGDAPDTGNEAANLFVAAGQDIASSEYRKQLRQKVIDNMPKVAGQGCWQGRAPFGYELADVLDGERRRLVKGSARDVSTVQRIFARFNAGVTLLAIAAELNRDRVPGPFDEHPQHNHKGSKPSGKHRHGRRPPCGKWTTSTVRRMLTNETYIGQVVYKPRNVRDERNRQQQFKTDHVPESHWVRASKAQPWWWSPQCPHEPIIDRKAFETAQRRLRDRSKPRHWSKGDHPYFLSGFLTCASCGGPVVGGGGAHYHAKDPGSTRFYRCRNGNSEVASCAGKLLTINQRWIESEVIGRVTGHVQRLVSSGQLAKLLEKGLRADDGTKRQAVLGREMQSLEAQRRTVVEKIAKGLITDEDAADTLSGIKGRLAAVGRELEDANARPGLADRKAEVARLLKLAADFPALIRRVPAPTARELLSYWLDGAITLDKRGRIGSMKLRQVPGSSVTQPRRAAAKRCWRAGCRRFSPR